MANLVFTTNKCTQTGNYNNMVTYCIFARNKPFVLFDI